MDKKITDEKFDEILEKEWPFMNRKAKRLAMRKREALKAQMIKPRYTAFQNAQGTTVHTEMTSN